MNNSYDSIKVVHILKAMSTDGITNVVMNYTCHLDKSKFKTTIISGPPVLDFHKAKCYTNGVEVIEVPGKQVSTKKYYLNLWKELKRGNFDIVHIHGNSATITIELLIAMLAGIRIRIAHCHSSSCDYLKVHKLLLPIFKYVYTKGFACSRLSGKWLFGDRDFEVLPNGFETKKFRYDQVTRDEMRKELGLEDKFVIGNVAGFYESKNHVYLLKIFEEVAKRNNDAVLFLVGEGESLPYIQELIKSHPYKERIIYYGVTDHVERLYNLMDTFVLPSKHEGLGLVLVEAQINGLKCITSDRVPEEVSINNQTVFLSLEDNIEAWVINILSASNENREAVSELVLSQADYYDIDKSVKTLEKCYFDLAR